MYNVFGRCFSNTERVIHVDLNWPVCAKTVLLAIIDRYKHINMALDGVKIDDSCENPH